MALALSAGLLAVEEHVLLVGAALGDLTPGGAVLVLVVTLLGLGTVCKHTRQSYQQLQSHLEYTGSIVMGELTQLKA